MTPTEATTYLSQLGLSIPEPMLSLLIAKSQEANTCLEENGVSETDRTLISYYLLALFGVSGGYRVVTSQSAPSGASQSYKYGDNNLAQYRSLRNSLRALDPFGCTAGLIPAEPGANAYFTVVKGVRCNAR